MAFELASTNLVIELGIILVVLMGWQFMAAEYVGGILMVIFLAVIFRLTLTPRLVQRAKEQAEKGRPGRMEGTCRDGYERVGRIVLAEAVEFQRFHGGQCPPPPILFLILGGCFLFSTPHTH